MLIRSIHFDSIETLCFDWFLLIWMIFLIRLIRFNSINGLANLADFGTFENTDFRAFEWTFFYWYFCIGNFGLLTQPPSAVGFNSEHCVSIIFFVSRKMNALSLIRRAQLIYRYFLNIIDKIERKYDNNENNHWNVTNLVIQVWTKIEFVWEFQF